MRPGTRITSLRAAVDRLEALARRGPRHCPLCRHRSFDTLWSDKPGPGAEVLRARCEFCFAEQIINLSGLPAEMLDVVRLFHSYKLEDLYTDPKAQAFFEWMGLGRTGELIKGKLTELAENRKVDPDIRAAARTQLGMRNLYAARHEQLVKRYGEEPFPEIRRLIDGVRDREVWKYAACGYVAGLYELERERVNHLARAELEKIIWGGTRAGTIRTVEETEGRIEELIAKAKKKVGETGPRIEEPIGKAEEEPPRREDAVVGEIGSPTTDHAAAPGHVPVVKNERPGPLNFEVRRDGRYLHHNSPGPPPKLPKLFKTFHPPRGQGPIHTPHGSGRAGPRPGRLGLRDEATRLGGTEADRDGRR